MSYIFDSQPQHIENLKVYPEEVIMKEPMFFRADLDFVDKHGGHIHRCFLDALESQGYDGKSPSVTIDSRLHMLKAGWYPCIPGWHLDRCPRTRSNGQPDISKASDSTLHYLAVFGSQARTQFLTTPMIFNPCKLVMMRPEDTTYKIANEHIESMTFKDTKTVGDGELWSFSSRVWHRGTPATSDSWRLLIRANIGDDKPVNQLRTQVNVYCDLNAGW